MSIIHYSKPLITDLEVCCFQDAVAKGQGECCYEYIRWFEELFRLDIGVMSGCTGALHMGLSGLGHRPG